MCKSIDDAWNGISDGATQLAGMSGIKGVGDAVTTGDISKVGDETGKAWAKIDDALYDAGVRWNDAAKIAAAGAIVYTGGLAAGAWGDGSAAGTGLGTATTTAGSTATEGAGSQVANSMSNVMSQSAPGAGETSTSWWSKQDPMTKYGIIQGAGQGINAVGSYLNQQEQQNHADQVRQEQQAIAEANRQRMGHWVPMSPIQQELHQNYLRNKPGKSGLIANQMNQS